MTTPAPDTPFPQLSPREREIALFLATGKSCRFIAEQLNISIKTVDTHRSNILKKLQYENSVDLCRCAIRNGWMKP